MVSRLSNIRPISRASLPPQYNLAKGLTPMPVNRDYYWSDDMSENLWKKIQNKNSIQAPTPTTQPVNIEFIQTKPTPMITLAESNERVRGAFETAINYLLLEIETHKKEASAVNIFDNLRLVKIGQKKVLQKAADHLYMLLHGHYPID